jgi:hypothetical protein
MKKDLIEKKKQLENQLIKINEEINLEILREDFEELCSVTDQLNSLFQNKIVEKYGDDFFRNSTNASNLLYDAMQILDKASVQLESEINDLEIELNKDENGK